MFFFQRLEKAEISRLDILFTFYVSVVIGTLDSSKVVTDSLISQLMPHIAEGLKYGCRVKEARWSQKS